MVDNKIELFKQIHIDVARNSTDDFNLFHDANKWHQITDNPFGGPIILGFQLLSLIEQKIKRHRENANEYALINENSLNFSHYQFNFANAVKADQAIEVEIKPTQFKSESIPILSNRVVLKAAEQIAMIGFKKESSIPLFSTSPDFSSLGDLKHHPDRCYLKTQPYFLKRKFLTTSNAKNFLCASLRNQSDYFDELQNKIVFPEVFPCSLISCALLEKAVKNHHDFEKNPMVYTSQKIYIDKIQLGQLKSNDPLHILIKPADDANAHDFGDAMTTPLDYECYGLTRHNAILFSALISLAPLATIVKALK